MGSDQDAKLFVERAFAASRRFGRYYGWMMLEGNRGLVALVTGDTPTARAAFREELRLSRELVVQPFAQERASWVSPPSPPSTPTTTAPRACSEPRRAFAAIPSTRCRSASRPGSSRPRASATAPTPGMRPNARDAR